MDSDAASHSLPFTFDSLVEDVIIHKLIAGRHQDIADIEAIVAGHLPLDETYLARWVGFWDVAATWQTLRPD